MVREKLRGKIIVFGILFWYPLAGVTYQFLHYPIGLRRLGYDPVLRTWSLDYDPDQRHFGRRNGNISAVVPLRRTALRTAGPSVATIQMGCYGMAEDQIQFYREADAFLNVTGAQEIREEHLACPRRIYVESDPFTSQVRVSQGDVAMTRWRCTTPSLASARTWVR